MGGVAEWSCSGLQSRGRRFDSDPRLQRIPIFRTRCGFACYRVVAVCTYEFCSTARVCRDAVGRDLVESGRYQLTG